MSGGEGGEGRGAEGRDGREGRERELCSCKFSLKIPWAATQTFAPGGKNPRAATGLY